MTSTVIPRMLMWDLSILVVILVHHELEDGIDVKVVAITEFFIDQPRNSITDLALPEPVVSPIGSSRAADGVINCACDCLSTVFRECV